MPIIYGNCHRCKKDRHGFEDSTMVVLKDGPATEYTYLLCNGCMWELGKWLKPVKPAEGDK